MVTPSDSLNESVVAAICVSKLTSALTGTPRIGSSVVSAGATALFIGASR